MTNWIKSIPLAESVRLTKESYRDFNPGQRRAVVLATAATLGRLALRPLVEKGLDRGVVSRKQAVLAHMALDSADTIDGWIARSGNAVTPWGKELDPLSDKIDFAIQDISRMRRGEIGKVEVGIRIGRDITSTTLRYLESRQAVDGHAHTAATWAGKSSTIGRTIANRIGDVAPGSRVAKVARHAATAGLVVSLASNVYQFARRKKDGLR